MTSAFEADTFLGGESKLEVFNDSGIELPASQSEFNALLEIIESDQKVGFRYVEIVFVDEEEIVRVNKEFLQRDYITDIISFRYDDDPALNDAIEGTLYCCPPRIREQAKEFADNVKQEFLRVVVHGLIHLIGYDDQSEEEKKEMTRLENMYLSRIGEF